LTPLDYALYGAAFGVAIVGLRLIVRAIRADLRMRRLQGPDPALVQRFRREEARGR
jgi:hypothetical protein